MEGWLHTHCLVDSLLLFCGGGDGCGHRDMGNGDGENTQVVFGTPVDVPDEDEEVHKKLPVQDQIVTDERGRRRFHGAFTGGFSAGYFNSVGTKQGPFLPLSSLF